MTGFALAEIADPTLYGNPQRLQAFFGWLRDEHPVAWVEVPGVRPFWVVSRHADVRDVERQAAIFRAGPRNTLMPIEVEEANRHLFGVETGFESLVAIDGDRHKELRAMTQDYFLPKNIRRLENMVDGLARDFVERLAGLGGACDIAKDVVFWYPLRVAMTILGIGPEDEARMLHLTHELFGSSDPEICRPGLSQAEHLVAVKNDYITFFDAVTADRLAHPRDDVATLIAQGLPGDRDLTGEERLGYYVIVATAGHDTTAASTVGGIRAIIEDPSLLARLRADPALIRPFVNEAIRYTAPVKHFFRNVAQDHVIAGVPVKAGEHVMLSYGAATRDEAAFPDAQRFVPDRTPNNHLAFGYGPHQCLGQFLAKLEMEAFFRVFVERVETIEADGQPLYTEAPFVTGIKSMKVRYTLRDPA